ncbi:MAG: type II toxin-antitoxin system RelE/ParE family toxin [Hyphomonadaceae bacterium]|nr:type II toxin-antitoxin system RelE/ParE family toxin [Hyphomonadaceae bacterium]
MHGFAKNAKSNITQKELAELKRLAAAILAVTTKDMRELVQNGDWMEVDESDGEEALQE